MRRVTWSGGAGIALTVGLVVAPDGVPAHAMRDPPTLELRVITCASLDPGQLELARETVTALLATGGLKVEWRECQGDGCDSPLEGRPFIRVLLLPLVKRSEPAISGEVVRDPSTKYPSVLVYVRRNADVTQAIRRSSAGRSNPALAALSTGDVVGLTIAHEVGHSLGLSHTATGPMRAQPAPEDLIALQRSMLRFPPMTLQADRLAGAPTPPLLAGKTPF